MPRAEGMEITEFVTPPSEMAHKLVEAALDAASATERARREAPSKAALRAAAHRSLGARSMLLDYIACLEGAPAPGDACGEVVPRAEELHISTLEIVADASWVGEWPDTADVSHAARWALTRLRPALTLPAGECGAVYSKWTCNLPTGHTGCHEDRGPGGGCVGWAPEPTAPPAGEVEPATLAELSPEDQAVQDSLPGRVGRALHEYAQSWDDRMAANDGQFAVAKGRANDLWELAVEFSDEWTALAVQAREADRCKRMECDGWQSASGMSHDLTCAVEARDAWRDYAEHAAGCVECGQTSWENCHEGGELRATAEKADKLIDPGHGAESSRLREARASTVATLRARVVELEGDVSAAIGSCEFMDPPDGGDVSLAEQVRRMRAALDDLRQDHEHLWEERTRLRESLFFFASVIRSGEPWTEHCEAAMAKATAPIGAGAAETTGGPDA